LLSDASLSAANQFRAANRSALRLHWPAIEINAPDSPPGDGVVMFTQCSIAEGSDWSKAVAAHKKYSAAYELYVNGGGWQQGVEALSGFASCKQGTPTVWDVKLVRQSDS